MHVVKLLNERGYITGVGTAFNQESVSWICNARGLKSHQQRLKESGLLTRTQMAKRDGVSCSTITDWLKKGIVSAHLCNNKRERLYYPTIRNSEKVIQNN